MELKPYFELITRQGKLNSVLMLGIKRIETDNFGSPQDTSGSFFPRIFIYYLNDNVVKLDFENEALEQAKEAYRSILKISEENMKYIIENPTRFIVINTLPNNDQDVLIQSTISFEKEEQLLNDFLNDFQKNEPIIVYGRNSCDISVEKKCLQLIQLGFDKVYMYVGGLFEWVLLQDIYGTQEFPTNRKVHDILRYRPIKQL